MLLKLPKPDMNEKTIAPTPGTPAFGLLTIAKSGIRHSWRISLAVALGVATATAVIVGALLVGDSMRGSLHALTVERLGETETVVFPGGFFDAAEIAKDPADVVPVLYFPSGVVESARDSDSRSEFRRAGSVQIIGCDQSFWDLDASGVVPAKIPSGDEVVLNASAAAELNVAVGDSVTVRLPAQQAVPADSPLGKKEIETEGLPRMKVVAILPDKGLGRFAIQASQAAPLNAYLSRETIADVLDREGQANALLSPKNLALSDLKIDLADLGLKLKRVKREFAQADDSTSGQSTSSTIYDYYSLTSDRLLLPEIAAEEVQTALPAGSVEPICTYLANRLEKLGDDGAVIQTVTYSTITGMDSSDDFPLDYGDRKDDDRIPLVINDWTADRLDAKVGTQLRIAYYEPEVEEGNEVERFFDAVVTGIVPITKPKKRYIRSRPAVFDKPPTIYNDPDLTPTVPGVTDQESMSDWDLPFELDREIPKVDDDYWKEQRLTPKAFLPLADAQRLFGSRFGKTTGLRISTDGFANVQELNQKIDATLKPRLAELGWQIRSIKQEQLTASAGTTPFDALFLSLSFFVIFSAILLIAMLFRLGLIARLKQFGTMLAVGWTPQSVTRLVLVEGAVVAAVGAIVGVIAGIGYAIFVLWALRSLWVGAVTVPFLEFHWTLRSLLIGALAGWFVAGLALWASIRSIMRTNARTLLSGREADSQSPATVAKGGRRSKLRMIAAVLAVLSIVAATIGALVGGQAAAGGFVGGGMMMLMAMLLIVYARLREPVSLGSAESESGLQSKRRFSVGVLAARNGSRSPLRSTMTIGLMASAAFLIIAITAFQLRPTDRGTGGFNMIAQTSQPIYRNLSDPKVQTDTFGADAKILSQMDIASMRVRLGQDASCNNLYRASQPTVLGIPDGFQGPAGFDWAAHRELAKEETPWKLLNRSASGTESDPIPMVLDQNTAMWSLQMYGGVSESSVRAFEYEEGKPIFFEVVGLLSNSILQGRVMISDQNFRGLFPEISGYQFFMMRSDPDQQESSTFAMEDWLGDAGMDVSDSKKVLSGMLAVQNTYLRTFQSLGAFGLLLGTIGLAIAQLRSVLERRRELAVMRAIGFTRKRLAAVVMSETAALLLIGIGCGAVCAVLAVLPHALLGGIRPPIVEPLLIIVGIIVFGLLAGLVAVRYVVKMPLLSSLRPE